MLENVAIVISKIHFANNPGKEKRYTENFYTAKLKLL